MTYMGDSYKGNPEILRRIGSYKVASPLVTIVANATIPGAYGTYAFDHEGILSGETIPLVHHGIWQGLLLSREMVAPLNKLIGREYFIRSNGMARAEGCDRIPLVRQANTELLPGPHSFEDLIGGIDHGFVFSGPDNWSMTFSRDAFAFGVEMGHEVRNGKIVGVVRNPGYMGGTRTFWKSCMGIGNESVTFNVDNCGKGDPAQTISTAHRTPPVLFEDVRITNRKQIGNGGGNVRQR
jgi:TldD protein